MARIRKDDIVKVISGSKRGTTGKVVAVLPDKDAALVEGLGVTSRKVKPTQLNPRGGTKDIHVPVPLSKLALVVDPKSTKTSRVGYQTKSDGTKVRVAKQANNKEIK